VTSFHPPHYEFTGQPEIDIHASGDKPPVAVIRWPAGNEYVYSDDDADTKIQTYLRAKDMLREYLHAVASKASLSEYVAASYVNTGLATDITKITQAFADGHLTEWEAAQMTAAAQVTSRAGQS
jgi:hypothetical protein